MKTVAPVCILCIATGLLFLTGCSNALTEAKVQAMIDKSIAKQLASKDKIEHDDIGNHDETNYGTTPLAAGQFNPQVDTDLNDADLAFRDGGQDENACQNVSNAIKSAAQGRISSEQSQQLKSYASRCRLRY